MSTAAPVVAPATMPQPAAGAGSVLVPRAAGIEQQLPRSSSPQLLRRLRALAVALSLVFVVVTAVVGFRAQADAGQARSDAAQFARIADVQSSLHTAHTLAAENLAKPSLDAATTQSYADAVDKAAAVVVQAGAADATQTDSFGSLAADIAQYNGDVHTAWAAKAAGNAGQATLDPAATVLDQQLTPALDRLAAQSSASYRAHSAGPSPVICVVLGVLALGAWLALAIVLALRTHRVLNVGVGIAVVAVIAAIVTVWVTLQSVSGLGLGGDGAALQTAQQAIDAGYARAVVALRVGCLAVAALGIGAAVAGSLGTSTRLREFA